MFNSVDIYYHKPIIFDSENNYNFSIFYQTMHAEKPKKRRKATDVPKKKKKKKAAQAQSAMDEAASISVKHRSGWGRKLKLNLISFAFGRDR